jgi:excinuclease ABC subunit C
VKIPPPITFEVNSSALAGQIAALPASAGIYSFSLSGSPPHVGWCPNLPRRLSRLFLAGRLRERLSSLRCWPTGSKLENSLLTYELVRAHFPGDYPQRIRLRMPWLVGLASADPFPRLVVANRIGRASGAKFGPFVSRDAAQRYEQEVLTLFQIRRCVEPLAPHPEHPGCIYGEMNQCLRPCQCAVTAEEYASEVSRVQDFLASNGRSTVAGLSVQRERACADLQFEEAAQIHKRIENLNAVAALRDEVVGEVDHFNGVALTAGAGKRSFRLWPMLDARWQEPIVLNFAAEDHNRKSLDQHLRSMLSEALQVPDREGNALEHLALFSRWYYSSWRDGTWFPFRTLNDLNYRRLVREISNLVKAS